MSAEAERPESMAEESRAPGRSRGRRLGCGLILAGLLVIVGWSAVTGWRLVARFQSLQVHLRSLDSLVEGRNTLDWGVLDDARIHLAGMRADLEEIEYLAGPFLPVGRLLRWVPGRGGDLAAAEDLLDVALGVVSAGDRVVQALAPAVELLDGSEGTGGPGPTMIEQLLPILVQAQPAIEAAEADLARVSEARARIEPGGLSAQTAGLLETLDRELPVLESALHGARVAPWLLGADAGRIYLVLAQNNHELRATGGFLSGVGELRIEGGRLVSVDFRDSYAVDNFQVPHDVAPPDFQALLSGELVFFRDTNWDPDFPTSARTAMAVYARDQGVEADGVLALDLDALRYLLEAVGPVEVPGLPDVVTAENVLQTIQAEWGDSSGGGADLEWWAQRKDFMGPLAIALLQRLVGGENLEVVRLAEAVRRALDEKHVLVYASDMDAAALVHDLHWDGAMPALEGAGDVLAVVDTNVGFNKVDANVDRAIRYEVDLGTEGAPVARLTLTYHNRSPEHGEPCSREPRYGDGYADLMTGCYWNYVRVYVPAGSRWLAGNGGSLPAAAGQDGGNEGPGPAPIANGETAGRWSVWASFIELAPGEEQTVAFAYELPARVISHDSDGSAAYRLHVQKQAGTMSVPLEVKFTLPAGAGPVSAAPAELARSRAVATDLRVDREFELAFQEEAEP